MPSSLENFRHDFLKKLNKIELSSVTKDAEQRVSSFKITSIVYHHLSDDEDVTDDEVFDSPVCKWSKFCNKCNQFITSTHHRNTRSTQTADKILYSICPNPPGDGNTPLNKEVKQSPRSAKITMGAGTASQIQSSMSEFNFPTTTRNTSIQYSPSLSSIPCSATKNWPIFHICATTTHSIITTSFSTYNSPLANSFVLSKLPNPIPFNLDTAPSDLAGINSKHVVNVTNIVTNPTVTISYRCLDPRVNVSGDSPVGGSSTPNPNQRLPTSDYIQPGTPTEILFARANMSMRENVLYNNSSPNVSRLFERSNISFDYTPNEGVSNQNFRGNSNTRPSVSSISYPALNSQRSYPNFRITSDEMRPTITQIASSGSVLSVPRYYSEPIFATSAEKHFSVSPPHVTQDNSQYIIVTEHKPTENEEKLFSTYYNNQRCNTVSSGSMAPIVSPSIFMPGFCNQPPYNPFNNIMLNVNSDTSIKLTNSLQNNNNLEIFIQSLNSSKSTTPSKLNVDKKSSPIKVVDSGKNKYCTLCLRSFCGQPDIFAENYESETVSREQNSSSTCPISISSDLLVGSDSKNENLLFRRHDPFS